MSITSKTSPLAQLSGTIVLAGAGKMGGALLTGWLAQGLDGCNVAVLEPAPSDDIAALTERGVRFNAAPQDLGTVDALVIAVKPQMFREAAAQLKAYVSPSTLVVSIMAGITVSALQDACGWCSIGAIILISARSRSCSATARCAPPALNWQAAPRPRSDCGSARSMWSLHKASRAFSKSIRG